MAVFAARDKEWARLVALVTENRQCEGRRI